MNSPACPVPTATRRPSARSIASVSSPRRSRRSSRTPPTPRAQVRRPRVRRPWQGFHRLGSNRHRGARSDARADASRDSVGDYADPSRRGRVDGGRRGHRQRLPPARPCRVDPRRGEASGCARPVGQGRSRASVTGRDRVHLTERLRRLAEDDHEQADEGYHERPDVDARDPLGDIAAPGATRLCWCVCTLRHYRCRHKAEDSDHKQDSSHKTTSSVGSRYRLARWQTLGTAPVRSVARRSRPCPRNCPTRSRRRCYGPPRAPLGRRHPGTKQRWGTPDDTRCNVRQRVEGLVALWAVEFKPPLRRATYLEEQRKPRKRSSASGARFLRDSRSSLRDHPPAISAAPDAAWSSGPSTSAVIAMLACPSWYDTRSGRAPAASAKVESDRADTRRDEHRSFGRAQE